MTQKNESESVNLHEIARNGKLSKIDSSILTVENLCQRDDDYKTIFEIAIDSGFINHIPIELLSLDNLKRQHALCDTTILHVAALNGCIDKIPTEILTDEHLLIIGPGGRTVAWQAASSGNLKQFPPSLLSARTLISTENPRQDGMDGAVDGGHLEQLPPDLLTCENMLLKDLENDGRNRFHHAACRGFIYQIPDKLLTLENLLTKDNNGLNIFHLAVQHGTLSQIPTCYLTIDNLTIKVDRVSGLWCSGWTSFHFAAYCGNLDQLPQEMLSEEILLTKAADGKSVYKLAVEGKSLKQIPKKLAAVLKGLHKPKKSDPGCPAGVYSWLKGGIMAVECIDEKQRSLVGCQKILKNDSCLLDAVAVIDEIDSGNWVVAHCGLYEEIPTLVSKKLKTKAAFLYYDDTSGLYGYSLFLNGKRQEEITSESDVSELLTTHKQSGIAASNHRGFEEVPMALIDNRFRELEICLPVSL